MISGQFFCSERISVFTDYPDSIFDEYFGEEDDDLNVNFDISWINDDTIVKTTHRYYHDEEYEEGIGLTYLASPVPTSYFVWIFSKIFHVIKNLI